jgi:hypothetical protein
MLDNVRIYSRFQKDINCRKQTNSTIRPLYAIRRKLTLPATAGSGNSSEIDAKHPTELKCETVNLKRLHGLLENTKFT